MRPRTPLRASALSAYLSRVRAAVVLILSVGCGEREVTEPPEGTVFGSVPPEVIRAAEEAGQGRDGQVIFLKQINPKTGQASNGQAQFVPFENPGGSARAAPARIAAVRVQSQPADHPNPYVTVAPNGLHLPPTYRLPQRDSATRNSLNTFCYYNGQYHQNTDFNVDSLTIASVVNTGGHEDAGHGTQKPKGRSNRTSGRSDALGEWPFTYFSDSTAGDDHLLFYYTVYDTDQPAFCRGARPPGAPYVFAKRWPGLIRIEPQAGLEYGTTTSAHFDVFYATPFAASLMPYVVELYQRNYPSDPVRLTAGTLIFGGLHDIRNTWRRPHNRHRVGTDVDLNAAPGGGGSERLQGLKRACERAGFVSAQMERPADTLPYNHTHCFHFVGYTGG